MSIRIRARRYVHRGERWYEVLGIDGVRSKDELPTEYIGTYPLVYGLDRGMWIEDAERYIGSFSVGHSYPAEKFEKIISVIRDAGDHLHRVNEKVRKLREEWKGEVEFVI